MVMDTVYHYCSAETFLNIVKYKKLWLSDIEHMNDFKEMRWFLEVYEDLIKNDFNQDSFQRAREEVLINFENTRRYMCCLSEDGDILSQWRGYAQNGEGVSIGLNPLKLNVKYNEAMKQNAYIKDSFFLNKVEYHSKESVRNIIIDILKSNVEVERYFSNANRQFGNTENIIQNKVVSFFISILHAAIHIKSPSFSEEREFRLVYNNIPKLHNCKDKLNKPFKSFLESKNYRISNKNLASYYEFPLPQDCITEIILGPKNIFSENDVRDFLRVNRINHNVLIKKSEATYR